MYFAPDADAARAVEVYLQSDTGSENERTSLEAMQAARVQSLPHVGADAERDVLLKGRLRDLTAQAQAGDSADAAPRESLGVSTLDELTDWTTSYLHFKQAVEAVP